MKTIWNDLERFVRGLEAPEWERSSGYPTWIRTMTRGVKVPCATVTPSGKTDLADLTVSHFALATRVADVERIRDQSGRATADESGPETRREREPFLFVQCKLKPTSEKSCSEKKQPRPA